ncbi:MAG: tRNA-dihydrouridine synthase family protein [Desulfovibrio sp.]|jgi:tRNA-dihydrouridine synthase B|nr:tRNA-dihydrouridine synthase family protein [Desulfovibrio sp.]
MPEPSLPIGRHYPWLAPLAGFSDLPFRLLCREYGAAVCVTEMVSAKGLVYASSETTDLLATTPEDRPLVIQIFGAEASFLSRAVALLRDQGFVWFDLNMGCSVRKVLRQGAGAAMLDNTGNALEAARVMLDAAGPGMVGFKLRLCPDEARAPFSRLKTLALRLQDMGAGWLTLHPRTAKQGFGGKADWDALTELAQCLTIPLLASGDLTDARTGVRCLDATGADGLMYARGALRNPAVFAEHLKLCRGEAAAPLDTDVLRAMILRHIALTRQLAPDKPRFWKMRAVIPRYVRDLPGARALRDRLCRCADLRAVEEALDIFWYTIKNSASSPVPQEAEKFSGRDA